MTNWAAAALQVLGCVGSFVAGYFGGKIGNGSTEQVGVQSVDINHPVFAVINSTNVRLDTLADQHAQHKEEVHQLLFIGLGAIALLAIAFILGLCIFYCWYRSEHRRKGPFGVMPEQKA